MVLSFERGDAVVRNRADARGGVTEAADDVRPGVGRLGERGLDIEDSAGCIRLCQEL
jgi:hypothetical protein